MMSTALFTKRGSGDGTNIDMFSSDFLGVGGKKLKSLAHNFRTHQILHNSFCG